jgi:hypothetical protein
MGSTWMPIRIAWQMNTKRISWLIVVNSLQLGEKIYSLWNTTHLTFVVKIIL